MRGFKRVIFLLLALTLLPSRAWPCSGFTAHDTTTVLIGNNEDFVRDWPTTIYFEPATSRGHGFVMWGYDRASNQGGMNDQGLFWDWYSTPDHDIAGDTGAIPFTGLTVVEMMQQCSTVDEAIAFLRLHRLSAMRRAQMFLVDANGDSAVFEGDVVNGPSSGYHIVTNFLPSRPELGNHPCSRYDAIEDMMTSGLTLTMDYFRDVAVAGHQGGTDTEAYLYTRYTTVCDLTTLECHLYYDLDFTDPYVFDLATELARGRHSIFMEDLFNPPPEETPDEPDVEPVPEVAEEADVAEPVPDASTDPADDPAVDAGTEPECEETGCGCSLTGAGSTGALALILVAAGLLLGSVRRRVHPGLVLAAAMVLASCGGKECPEGDAGTDPAGDPAPEPDAVIDVEPEVTEDPAEDEVVEEGLSFLVLADGDAPVEGATVALDIAFSARAERLTGAGGRVVFPGTAWSSDRSGVSAHKPGHSIVTYLDVTEERAVELETSGDDVVLRIREIAEQASDAISVFGTATGLTDTAHPYVVTMVRPMIPFTWEVAWAGPSDGTFTVLAPMDLPFTLLAAEMALLDSTSTRGFDRGVYRVMLAEYPATSTDVADVVLDLAADEMTLTSADIQLNLPVSPTSPLRSGDADCIVVAEEAMDAVGWSTALEFDPDNDRLDVSFSWVEPEWVEKVWVTCYVTSADGFNYSTTAWAGYPDEVGTDRAFDPPVWATPAYPLISVPLYDPVRWNLFGTDLFVEFVVLRGHGLAFWHVYPGTDALMLALPDPPSSVASEDFFDVTAVFGILRAGTYDEGTGYMSHFTQAEIITLEP